MYFRRRQLATLLCISGLLPIATSAAAMELPYPRRPITIVAGYPPGGGLDTLARLLAKHLATAVGQKILIEYRPGAASNIAADAVARSAPDGYTLYISGRPNTIHKLMYAQLQYDFARDLAPVALLATVPYVVVVGKDAPIRGLDEVLALANTYPGMVTCGSAGVGTSSHLLCELFQQMSGTQLLHVPYRGAAPAIADLVGGRVDIQFSQLPTVLPYIRAGSVRAIATISPRRLPSLHQVPTIEEAGFPGLQLESWYGLMAPARTPATVIEKLNRSINAMLMDPDLHAAYVDLAYAAPLGPNTPDTLRDLISRETTTWTKVILQRNISPAH
ncbi:Bug family tripartite tricarboxylate transporter substrate binding protein [Bordetella bronchialis]|uniref:MFS transporter n=2 Tax=Bordetella bronchialis TaxID=463025 RepID=A0A193FEA0_9BORD|nr:tripartite tricarboxylate transporter substrate binding protein [Bordetella bronchialis]ANN65608.1 hypothetical protein BAU06_04225 [Bordetella bronchialis]ANN70635.1 hypothetical protein BAU08_04190 [Bordetella bronchialis]